jgi:hypothetical protein
MVGFDAREDPRAEFRSGQDDCVVRLHPNFLYIYMLVKERKVVARQSPLARPSDRQSKRSALAVYVSLPLEAGWRGQLRDLPHARSVALEDRRPTPTDREAALSRARFGSTFVSVAARR